MTFDVFSRAGALRSAYEGRNWSETALGDVEGWSPTLVAALDFVVSTRFPVTMFWGPEFVLLYNEAYVPILGEKHPASLGERAERVFPEAWDLIGDWMRDVRAGGEPVYLEDALVPLWRDGAVTDSYFTFCYSPVRGPSGVIEGVIDVVAETTDRVVGARRLALLAELRDALNELQHPHDVLDRPLRLLQNAAQEFAAVDLRLDGDRSRWDASMPSAPTGEPDLFWLDLGGESGAGMPPVMVVRSPPQTVVDADYLGFLRLVASSIALGLARRAARSAERERARAQREIAETMQRSLLPVPVEPDHLQVTVRYRPAVEEAQIGGDWYDAFKSPGGDLTVVIGDVTGHDRFAAAAMAQVRNLLRGVAYTGDPSPAGVLARLDATMYGLAVGVYASCVVARVTQDEAQQASGERTLQYSNAGHPPPILLPPDGVPQVLEHEANLLLGMGRGVRDDHAARLDPGATVVFYTDGLIERRRASLEDGIAWLVSELEGLQELDGEGICDHLLAQLDDGLEDDVALLVLRAHPENAPRPDSAGPEVLPADLRDSR